MSGGEGVGGGRGGGAFAFLRCVSLTFHVLLAVALGQDRHV